jgi:hypothetical protein
MRQNVPHSNKIQCTAKNASRFKKKCLGQNRFPNHRLQTVDVMSILALWPGRARPVRPAAIG